MVTSEYSPAASSSLSIEYASGGHAYWKPRTATNTTVASLMATAYRPAEAVRVVAEQIEAVDDLQRVHAGVGRHRGQPEVEHRAQVVETRPQREAPAQHPPEGEHDHGRGAEVPQQQPAGALAREHDQRDREAHAQQTLARGRVEVGALAFVHPQLRVGHLEVREGPQPEDRAVDQQRVVEAEQRLRERAGEGDRDQRGDGRRPRHRGGGGARDTGPALLVVVVEVEADERLPDPAAQQDAHEDHGGQQRFRGPVALGADVPRVQRQRQQRQALGEDVPELVRRAGYDQALQVAQHSASDATGAGAHGPPPGPPGAPPRAPPGRAEPRASAAPTASRVQVNGSSRKSA